MAEQIEVKNVGFEYPVDSGRVLAVKDINFSVGQSEFPCLLGPSGCGKTTILNILAGLLQPTDGEIRIGNAALDKNAQNRGIVFQDFAQLFPWRTARKNIEFGLEMRGIDRATLGYGVRLTHLAAVTTFKAGEYFTRAVEQVYVSQAGKSRSATR